MILDKFIKQSKWQNASPEARKATLEDINDPSVLSEIVQQAEESSLVRRAAVKKIDNLELLDKLAKTDNDVEVRDQAAQRVKQVLCGKASLDIATRLAWVKNTSDANVLEHVAKHAPEPEVRLAALSKVERESVLGDVAIEDAKPEIRVAAVERLTQKSTLERVFKATRSQDKQVSRIAREKLDGITEQLERPARLKTEAEAMCNRLEALLQLPDALRNWTADKAEFDRLAARWQSISAEIDTEFHPRFNQSQHTFHLAYTEYQQHQAEIQHREQEYAPIRAAKQQLCEHLESLLNSAPALDGEVVPATFPWNDEKLAEWRTQWEYLGQLHPTEESRWQDRFNRLINQAQQQFKAWQELNTLGRKSKDLLRHIKDLTNSGKLIKRNHLKEIEQRWEALRSDKVPAVWQPLEEQLKQQFAQLDAAMKKQLNDADQAVLTLQTLLKDLETSLEQGILHEAIPLEHKARELLKAAVAMSPVKQQALEKRLQKNALRIRELRDWELWSDDLEREKLCAQIEAIIPNAADDPEETARIVREAQETWKKMDEHGHPHRFRRKKEDSSESVEEDIYKRFIKACNEAYEPCRQYFEKKAKERAANLLKKEQLCEKMEQFAQNTAWEIADWKKVYHFVRDADKEWHRIGTTDRKTRKKLKERYDAAMHSLETHLDEERKRNILQRKALIRVVQAVSRGEKLTLDQAMTQLRGESTEVVELTGSVDKNFDLDKAIEQVKELQEKWYVSVPGERKEERELWKKFRETCDKVFQMREDARKQKEQEVQHRLEAKEAVCVEFETFLKTADDEHVRHSTTFVRELRIKWDNIINLPKKPVEALEKRFRTASKRLEDRRHQLLLGEQRKQLDLLKQKAALCAEVERAIGEDVLNVVARVTENWSHLPTLLETALETKIQQRFQLACQQAGNISFKPTVLKEREELCIRFEILAGIDSPPEAREARMAYQVKRLSEAMKGGLVDAEPVDKSTELQQLEQAWYLAGAVPAEAALKLEARFQQGLQAIEHRRTRKE